MMKTTTTTPFGKAFSKNKKKEEKSLYILGPKLNMPCLAVAMMIPTIAMASTTTAIVLNSGITDVPITSIDPAPAGKPINSVLVSSAGSISPGSVYSALSINAANSASSPSAVLESITSLGSLRDSVPLLIELIVTPSVWFSPWIVIFSTEPPVIIYSIGCVWPPTVRSNGVHSPPPVALIAGTSASSVVAASVALVVAASVWPYVVPI